MGVTLIIAIPTGAFVGFLASRMPMPLKQFDDRVSFHECEYGDDSVKFNKHKNTEEVEKEVNKSSETRIDASKSDN